MVNKVILNAALKAKELAQKEVDYTPKYGAVCPGCQTAHMRVVTSYPWKGNEKIRYHKCKNENCLCHIMNVTIKSVQINKAEKKYKPKCRPLPKQARR